MVNDAVSIERVQAALQQGVPLLVPDHLLELKNLCRRENCGLYYRDAAETYECLHYLVNNRAIAAALGRNGRAYWNSTFLPYVM